MKLLTIGKCLAATAVIFVGVSVSQTSSHAAAGTCTVTTIKNFKGACPPGTKFEGGSAGHVSVLPEPPAATVTPTGGGPASCVKTNIHNFKNACPVG